MALAVELIAITKIAVPLLQSEIWWAIIVISLGHDLKDGILLRLRRRLDDEDGSGVGNIAAVTLVTLETGVNIPPKL